MTKKLSPGRIVFQIFNYSFMILICIICVIPIWHVFMASISEPAMVEMAKGFILKPLGKASLNAYRLIAQYKGIWRGYLNTMCYVAVQCCLTTFLTVLAGYILSRSRFRYRNFIMGMITFTMMFNGGMIPTYMVIRQIGLLDTYASQILPMAMQAFYIIIMRTSIMQIPESLEESARIDGAGEWRIMFTIIIPLIKSTIAVVVLFVAVAKWNEWFPALMYLPQATEKYPLQIHLRQILIQSADAASAADTMDANQLYKTLAKYASIMVSTLPIMCIYPFVQKYFVTGVMIGSVKG